MKRLRCSNGRFTNSSEVEKNDMVFQVNRNYLYLILKVSLITFILSPWIFLLFKRDNVDFYSTKIGQFYEDSFTCSCPNHCPMPVNSTNEETPNKGKDVKAKIF